MVFFDSLIEGSYLDFVRKSKQKSTIFLLFFWLGRVLVMTLNTWKRLFVRKLPLLGMCIFKIQYKLFWLINYNLHFLKNKYYGFYTVFSDMHKFKIILPAEFKGKSSGKEPNQRHLLGIMNFSLYLFYQNLRASRCPEPRGDWKLYTCYMFLGRTWSL